MSRGEYYRRRRFTVGECECFPANLVLAWIRAEGYWMGLESGALMSIEKEDSYGIRIRIRYGQATSFAGLETTRTPLGGDRWWWVCPACCVRRARLYVDPRGRGPLCRDCLDLTYQSCQENHRMNAMERMIMYRCGYPKETLNWIRRWEEKREARPKALNLWRRNKRSMRKRSAPPALEVAEKIESLSKLTREDLARVNEHFKFQQRPGKLLVRIHQVREAIQYAHSN